MKVTSTDFLVGLCIVAGTGLLAYAIHVDNSKMRETPPRVVEGKPKKPKKPKKK